MPSHLSSLLSTFAYIGIGLAYKLYQRLLCFLQAEPVSTTQLNDLFHIDVLHLILAQIPLQKRLQTVRQVNRQWAETVAQQCSTQRKLALQIGPNNEWVDFKNSLKGKTFLSNAVVDAVNGSPKLNIDQLTEQVTSFLIATFPRLKTLTVLVDEPHSSEETQDQNSSFAHLPVLISAMADNITALFLVFKTGNREAFQAHFPQLAASINSLSKLECLSLIDNGSEKLTIPSFDFPLLRSLKGLEFYVECSSTDFLQNWEPHLSAQKHNLIWINMNVLRKPHPSLSPNAAAHFFIIHYSVYSLNELRHFSNSFRNLICLVLETYNMPSLSSTLAQLTNLRKLKQLSLRYFHRRVIDDEAEGVDDGNDNVAPPAMPLLPLPSLPSLQSFCLFFRSVTFKHSDLAGFHPSVFPNAQFVAVTFLSDDVTNRPDSIDKATGCADCGWRLEYESEEPEPVVDQLRQCQPQMRQCLTHFAALFATTKRQFQALIYTHTYSYLLCRFGSEDDWPLTKVNDSDKDGDDFSEQQFQVPEKCFQLNIGR